MRDEADEGTRRMSDARPLIEHAADDVCVQQVLVSASPGDAITNLARSLHRVFRRVGRSEIYAWHVDPSLLGEIRPLWEFRARPRRSVLFVHASIGQPAVHEFLQGRDEPIVLMYHNVTPAHYFEAYDTEFADLLALGRLELELMRPRVVAALAASQYNARELDEIGYDDVRVVPPVRNLRRLSSLPSDPDAARRLEALERPIILSVAQMMPHKRPDFLVATEHVGQTYLGLRGTLLLVGHQRIPRYADAIRRQVAELNLPRVFAVGAVSEHELAAMFRAAAVVVSASEHEGFCLPLVEAMTFGTPVIARACAAVPDTVGDAGLLLAARYGPTMFAEAAAELLANTAAQEHLIARGYERVEALERTLSDDSVLDTVLAVA
jgi:glycosyltransferase involved in cell wall biosynthesis